MIVILAAVTERLWDVGLLLVGGAIGWLISQYFAHQASKDTVVLRQLVHDATHEIQRLRQLVNILARYLDREGVIRAEFRADGDVTWIVTGQGALVQGPATLRATGTVTPPPSSMDGPVPPTPPD
jgi:hypothetical protein